MTPREVLDLPMDELDNDAQALTIRGYLTALLARLWEDKEGFNGKRPFGNSGWEGDVYVALVKGGVIQGTLDEDGYLDECDDEGADALIAAAILELGGVA